MDIGISMSDAPATSASAPAPPAGGAIRRIRQACSNCRSKKIKCSGERPTCVHCRRLKKQCHYEPCSANPAPAMVPRRGPVRPKLSASEVQTVLLERISSIEDQLARMSGRRRRRRSAESTPGFESPNDQRVATGTAGSTGPDVIHMDPDSDSRSSPGRLSSTLPPWPVVEHLISTYFLRSHGRPYSYFHEATFRTRLADGQVPQCLLLAVLATALRFSNHDFYQGCTREAVESYAREAWLCILNDHMTADNSPQIYVAQATNILAIIDFTAGRISSAWLKIGLAIRIAQDLQLMNEPDPALPPVEQEERRRCFWSIYLLDKLVSCGKDRHPVLSDDVCHLQLPCNEVAFRNGVHARTTTLEKLFDWEEDSGTPCGYLPLTILAGSVLGRCTQSVFRERGKPDKPPWDTSSENMSTVAALLMLESRLQIGKRSLYDTIHSIRAEDGSVDHYVAGQAVLAHVIFHLGYCLIMHPFLLRRQLQRNGHKPSVRYLTLAFQKSYDHARSLCSALTDACKAGVLLNASFYAYAACVASGILVLNLQLEQSVMGIRASEMLSSIQETFSVLQQMGLFWDHALKMYQRLEDFQKNGPQLGVFADPSAFPDTNQEAEAVLWGFVDYGTMCAHNTSENGTPGLHEASVPDASRETVSDSRLYALGPDTVSDLRFEYRHFDGFDLASPTSAYLLDIAASEGLS